MPPKQELPTTRKIGWDCTLCTFKNLPYRPGCEICGTACPAGYVPPPDYVPLEEERKFMEKEGPRSLSGHAQFTGWECPLCTLKNLPHRPSCETCGTTRPAGYVPPPDYVPVGEDRRYSDKDEYDKQQILMVISVVLLFCNEFFLYLSFWRTSTKSRRKWHKGIIEIY